MTLLSSKTVALSAVLALGSLMSGSAHAASILQTAGGNSVYTKDGAAVLVGSPDAYYANLQARAIEFSAQQELVRERTVYFNHNSSILTKGAQHHLRRMAAKLRVQPAQSVAAVGFSDTMGNAAYNERLALKRAKAVRDFLVARGVPAGIISVRSLGKSAPRAECPATLARAEKIACLREDRRVEIEVK